jgi:hypothetical protein
MARTTLHNVFTTTTVSNGGALAHIPTQAGEQDAPEAVETSEMDDRHPRGAEFDIAEYDDEEDDEQDEQDEDTEDPNDGRLDEDDTDLSLDEDPDTSLVGSLYLHLLSEHNCYRALALSDDAAIELHQQLHREAGQNHGIADRRFRPGRALAVSLRCSTDRPTEPPA